MANVEKRKFWDKVLAPLGLKKKQDAQIEASDKSIMTSILLIKKEKKKCDRLREKVQDEYLQPQQDKYSKELLQILEKKLKEDQFLNLKQLPYPSFIVKSIEYVKDKSLQWNSEEERRCKQCIKQLWENAAFQSEMQNSLEMEKYYKVTEAVDALKLVVGHICHFIHHLTQETDRRIEILVIQYLEGYTDQKGKNLLQLSECVKQLPKEKRDALLSDQSLKPLVAHIFRTVGTEVVIEIKQWVKNTKERILNPSQNPSMSSEQEKMRNLDMKDLSESMQKLKELQNRLKPNELKKYLLTLIQQSATS